ncbi:hypothetical protein ACHAW5_010556 [Stephanodiscus triporus]|uniref:Uncharacterized protein n=1 Tax=Stephanodiscus triporus TaxID=2934178 RepID=A0ABD3N3U2_9STRA
MVSSSTTGGGACGIVYRRSRFFRKLLSELRDQLALIYVKGAY